MHWKINHVSAWVLIFMFGLACGVVAISPSSIMMRASVLEAIGGFDTDLAACEDYDLWLRLASRYPLDFIPEKLIIKTGGHADQLSQKYRGMDRFRVYALEKNSKTGSSQPATKRLGAGGPCRKMLDSAHWL